MNAKSGAQLLVIAILICHSWKIYRIAQVSGAMRKKKKYIYIYESGPNISDSEIDQTTSTIPNSPQKKSPGFVHNASLQWTQQYCHTTSEPEPGSLPKLLPVRHCELGPALIVRLGNERKSVGMRQSHLIHFDEF